MLQSDMQYTGRCIVHLDAFCWVQRDSYLPQGNQGLKAVTKYKLGYDPVEVDPEDMLRFAKERPHHMASYSVSDAVATYYLYNLYVHNFIFSLSTIIPMVSEDVLRKGSGTLCEALLMVEAYKGNIVCPNKQVDPAESFYDGHLLESETYIGGHVECLEAGVFRADIPVRFQLVPSAFQQLIDKVDRDLTFALEVENGIQRSDIANYDEVKQQVVEKLEILRDCPDRMETPLIYHLDVGAMYPNIILTNRLQPSSIVDMHDCASCKFNQSSNECKRPMTWTWRGEFSPAGANEYAHMKQQLSIEKPTTGVDGVVKAFPELSAKEQANLVRARLKNYSQRVYRKMKVTKIEERVSTVCMRENSFYVDTVKAFRDRRYDYKILTKVWKNKKSEADKKGDMLAKKQAEDREILMDSLQLAHKCILNSFYGYVMRKGARWRSMEMAGIVTHTGAQLIRQARELVEQVGRPLELDTDGIWCILPAIFPQNFTFFTKQNNSKVAISYPCAMLNADVHDRYTNHQYQVLEKDGSNNSQPKYAMHSECSIFFELDGPYKAMVLPASPEEGRLLKKKYVVFNFNGSIAELKGFELKRRGELELVKIFQSQVFEQFLAGKSLSECYSAVAEVANQWLDVLDSQGVDMDDEELMELISEKKTISKTVDDYEGRKSTSLTTAGRLADFLGAEMTKDKGLNCKLVISRYPEGAPVTDRAIPVAIFSCEPAMRRYFLRKWLKDNNINGDDFRPLIDWDYYKDRLGKTIQKIVTIPAGMQFQDNPVPRVEHPPWLTKRLESKNSGKKQVNIRDAFRKLNLQVPSNVTESGKMSHKLLGSSTGLHFNVNKDGRSQTEGFDDDSDDAKLGNKRVHFLSEGEKEECAAAISGSHTDADTSVDQGKKPDQSQAPDVPSFLSDPPSTKSELQSWLRARKATWRARRAYDRQQRSSSHSTAMDQHLTKRSGRVLDFVQQASHNALHNTWQILEIQKLDQQPGEFVIWALTSPTQLQRLSLSVNRTIFVNIDPRHKQALATAERLGGKLVKKDLPHGKECLALYELQLSESKFQRHEKTLDLFFTSPEVEGVYESQVPLDLTVIMQTGCVTKFINATASRTALGPGKKQSKKSASQALLPFQHSGKYQLNELEMVSTKSFPYLDVRTAQFKKIFIYFAGSRTARSATSIGQIGILGLFFVKENNIEEAELQKQISVYWQSMQQHHQQEGASTSTPLPPVSCRAYVWVIHGRTGAAAAAYESKPPLQRLYRKFQPTASAEMKFSTLLVADNESAFKQANERLEQYQRERPGPCLVIAQGGNNHNNASTTNSHSNPSTAAAGNPANGNGNNTSGSNSGTTALYGMDAGNWRAQLPALHDFPVTVMPAHSQDEAFPAIGWSIFAAERMIQRFLFFPRWFEDRLSAARFAQIPIGNFQADALTTMTDVLYARQLRQYRHVLWASDTNRGVPDIGQGIHSHHDLWYVWSDPLPEPVLNHPGIYRQYVVELDVYGLAVCAIMHSMDLDDGSHSSHVHIGAGGGSSGVLRMKHQAFADMSAANANSAAEGSNADGLDPSSSAGMHSSTAALSDQGCFKAFAVLKSIVAHCVEEVRHHNDAVADGLLTAIYRYLCGYGHGLLHDPQLHRLIYQYMVKLFAKLMQTFQHLGTQIVYADFNRILIATKHAYDLPQALEYIDFLLSAVSTKKLFSYVQLSVKQSWRAMIWLEPENWAALNILAPEEPDEIPDEIPEETIVTEESQEKSEPIEMMEGDEEHKSPSASSVSRKKNTSRHGTSFEEVEGEDEEEEDEDGDGDAEFGDAPETRKSSHAKSVKISDDDFFASLNNSSTTGAAGASVTNGKDEDDDDAGGDLRQIKRCVRNKQLAMYLTGSKTSKKSTTLKHKYGHRQSAAFNASEGMAEDKEDDASIDEEKDEEDDEDRDEDVGEYDEFEEAQDRSVDPHSAAAARAAASGSSGKFESVEALLDAMEEEDRLRQEQFEIEDERYYDTTAEDAAALAGQDARLVQHWNLLIDQPDAAVIYFEYLIGEYLLQYADTFDRLRHPSTDEQQETAQDIDQLLLIESDHVPNEENLAGEDLEAIRQQQKVKVREEIVRLDDEEAANQAETHVQHWIERDFTSKMLQIIDDLQLSYISAKHAGRATSDKEKHLALEFVKMVTHLLLLDTRHRDTVSTARRLLLAQLQLPEFSELSQFVHHQNSYILHDVLCSYCSLGRDLDLLRDAQLLQAAQEAAVTGAEAVWRCGHCDNTLNREEIENR